MKNYWVSWRCKIDDMGKFELNWPWWISGEGDDYYNTCTAIKASSEEKAIRIIEMSYDMAVSLDMRFIEEKPEGWSPFSDRFSKADWMNW